MREISVFADESGDKSNSTRYFLLTLVFHEQSERIAEQVAIYERSLARADMPNIPFHSEPLLNGHKVYEYLDPAQRKKLLSSFGALVRYLLIEYATFAYRRNDFDSPDKLSERMRRDITDLFQRHLDYYQGFDRVKVYYDNAQAIVNSALYEAVKSVLAKQAVIMRRTTMTEYRLSQVADYLCTIELAAIKYNAKESGATYEKFFGTVGKFKKNWLKQVRRKQIS